MSYKPSDMNQAKTPSWLVRLASRVPPVLPDISRARGAFFSVAANAR